MARGNPCGLCGNDAPKGASVCKVCKAKIENPYKEPV